MQLKVKGFGIAFIALMMGAAQAQSGRDRIERLPPAPAQGQIMGGDRDPSLPVSASPVPQDKVNYDEVGYASWYGPDRAGAVMPDGEPFDPAGVSATHATLPVPSYAEITDLRTGRTILVRINDNSPPPKGRIVALSLGAARQLGVETEGTIPVRVRRTNPPEFERNALAAGGQAAERLPTPPALLNALRKKLGPAPAATSVATRLPPKAAARPAMPPRKPAPPPAADIEPDEEMAPVARDGRFVEEIARPHWRVGRMAAPQPAPPAPAVGNWFVQVAAFSSEARARAAAAQVGGAVVRAGEIYRVRTGPYASEASARAAVGAMAAKGYPGARPVR